MSPLAVSRLTDGTKIIISCIIIQFENIFFQRGLHEYLSNYFIGIKLNASGTNVLQISTKRNNMCKRIKRTYIQ